VGDGRAVLNDHVTGAMALPLGSSAETLTEYVAPCASGLAGVSVAVVPAASRAVAEDTVVPLESFSTMLRLAGLTASLNVAVGVTLVDTLVSPATGLLPTTLGAVVSGAVPGTKTGSTQ
jgi:hypothetical protein